MITPAQRARHIFLDPPAPGEARTRVVATQGPNSDSYDQATAQLEAGLDVARFNLSHASHEWTVTAADTFRRASEATGKPVAILADLPGPRVRIGKLPGGSVELQEGQPFVLGRDGVEVSQPAILTDLEPGQMVFLKDRKIAMEVVEKNDGQLVCQVTRGGTLTEKAGISLPGAALDLPLFPEDDAVRLGWAAEVKADMVAVSNVRDAGHLRLVREEAHRLGYDPIIVAKPEDISGLRNLSEIVDEADVVMVPRGDWASNTDMTKIAVLEELTINLCKLRGKPVIDATEMMENLEFSTSPARSDVANVHFAVRSGASATMLSGETASPKAVDPVNAVKTMDTVARQAEALDESLAKAAQPMFGGVGMSEAFILDYLARLAEEISARSR